MQMLRRGMKTVKSVTFQAQFRPERLKTLLKRLQVAFKTGGGKETAVQVAATGRDRRDVGAFRPSAAPKKYTAA